MKSIRWLFSSLIIFHFFGCSNGFEEEVIDSSVLLHGKSSRIYLINRVLKKDKDFSPFGVKFKDVISFYNNGKCYIQPFHSLGDTIPAPFMFTVKKRILKMKNAKGEHWDFKIKAYQDSRFLLIPLASSNTQFTLEMTILPQKL